MSGIQSTIGIHVDDEDGNDDEDLGIGGRTSSSCQRRPSSVSLIFDGFHRKSFSSYRMLPPEPLKLSVLKLDGSCFDLEVMRTATVLELKEAVESVFSHMQISWQHVWGQFCLCYDGQKLVTDTDNMVDYGIKDGDQLPMIRLPREPFRKQIFQHYGLLKSIIGDASPYLFNSWLLTGPLSRTSSREERTEAEEKDSIGDGENGDVKHCKNEDDLSGFGNITPPSWQASFSYSRLPMVGYKDEATNNLSRCADTIWSRFRKVMIFCGTAPYSQKDFWRDD